MKTIYFLSDCIRIFFCRDGSEKYGVYKVGHMTQVLILLAALHGYHDSKEKCEDITGSLISLAVYNGVYGKDYRNYSLDKDLHSIREFNSSCQEKK